ncbi:hypothetical protein AN414_19435 [Serratia marcescens]|nr:hypothetical protein AN414_19435 [Serratia marcescens]
MHSRIVFSIDLVAFAYWIFIQVFCVIIMRFDQAVPVFARSITKSPAKIATGAVYHQDGKCKWTILKFVVLEPII